MIQTNEEMCLLRRTEPIFAKHFMINNIKSFFEVEEIRLHKPLTPPNYANIGVFVSVMKHKYYCWQGINYLCFTARQDYFILSRFNRKMGWKREIPENNHSTTRKQNLACLTCDPSETRTYSGELTSDLEH